MTVKQLMIGSLLGAGAIGLMIHRLPRQNSKDQKAADKQASAPAVPASLPATKTVG
jgi:hypothetical protein